MTRTERDQEPFFSTLTNSVAHRALVPSRSTTNASVSSPARVLPSLFSSRARTVSLAYANPRNDDVRECPPFTAATTGALGSLESIDGW